MALVTYEFYTETYKGDVVADSSVFEKILFRATSILNRLTFKHIVFRDDTYGQVIGGIFEPFTEDEFELIQYGLCSLIDAVSLIDNEEKRATAGTKDTGNVKSMSSGGESVTYESKSTIYDEALKDNSKKMQLYKNAVIDYMNPSAFRHNPFFAGTW